MIYTYCCYESSPAGCVSMNSLAPMMEGNDSLRVGDHATRWMNGEKGVLHPSKANTEARKADFERRKTLLEDLL